MKVKVESEKLGLKLNIQKTKIMHPVPSSQSHVIPSIDFDKHVMTCTFWASLIAQLVKNLPAMQGTQVRILGWEYPLEKEVATHSSFLA